MSVNKISFQNAVSKKYEMINSCTKLEPIQTKQKIYKNYLVIEIIINLKIRTKGSNARWSFFLIRRQPFVLLFFCSYLFLFCRNILQLYILSLWITIATAILYSIFSFRIKSKTSPSYKGAMVWFGYTWLKKHSYIHQPSRSLRYTQFSGAEMKMSLN